MGVSNSQASAVEALGLRAGGANVRGTGKPPCLGQAFLQAGAHDALALSIFLFAGLEGMGAKKSRIYSGAAGVGTSRSAAPGGVA